MNRTKTAHLSLAEIGAYVRLADYCKVLREPLPSSLARLYRIAGAETKEEQKAVRQVLLEFFVSVPGGYAHHA